MERFNKNFRLLPTFSFPISPNNADACFLMNPLPVPEACVMGNRMSLGRSKGRGKIVYWDGWVEDLEKAVTVGELMIEHPQQVVVEFHSPLTLTHKTPIPLPADTTLDTNKLYLMLPLKRGKPLALNTQHTRRILLLLNSPLHSNSLFFLSRLPCFCHPKPPIHMEDHQTQPSHDYQCCEFLPEFIQGTTPQYLTRQLSARGWKPSLDPIKEKKIERNLSASACLFLKRF